MKAEKFNNPLLNMMNSPSSAADVWTRKQPETDEEPAENTAPVHTYDELKKMRRNAYIKMVAIVGIIVTALAFGSVAWFTESREVEGSAVQMTSSDLPFEIATKGTRGIRYQELFSAANPVYKLGEETNVANDTYYQTSGSTEKIMLRYDAASGASVIGPGGRGELNLYIVPKSTGSVKAKITLDVQGYAYFDVYDLDAETGEKIQKIENGELVYQTTKKLLNVNDATADMCTLDADEVAALKESAQYLKGHILFFGDLGYEDEENENLTDDDQWYFTTPYINRVIAYENNNVVKGTMYRVPIYWMWSNTLGQIILKQANVQRNGIPLVKDLTNDQLAVISNPPEGYQPTDKELLIQ